PGPPAPGRPSVSSVAERVLPAVGSSRLWAAVLRAWTWAMSLRPAYVLAGLVVVQWLALLGLVASIRHNGWLFYQGGDETFYYTAGWGISGGHLPQTAVGYGWTLLLAPIALVATMGAAWLFLRALDSRGTGDAVIAGLLAGLSIEIKPADALLLGGVILALLFVREWRLSAYYAAGIASPLLTLAVGKERGL